MKLSTNFIALILTAGLFFAAVFEASAQTEEIVASGGTFTIHKSVVAGGGRAKQLSPVNEHGTAGQTIAGVRSNGGQFSLYSGFWTPENFAPTAAMAVVSGRVKTADGRGIRNVYVTITFPTGETLTTASSTLGYYSFTEIPSGATYVISVAAKRYAFSQPSQVRQIMEDATDVDFIADAVEQRSSDEGEQSIIN